MGNNILRYGFNFLLLSGVLPGGLAIASEQDVVELFSTSTSFSPASGQLADIEIFTKKPGKIVFEIMEPDGNVVHRVLRDKLVEPGSHKLAWNGKDSTGQIVPDEAYSVRVELLSEDNTLLGQHDPRETSGGELIDGLTPELSHTHIGFTLPESARVLIRLGLRDGPMLNNVLRWEPRVAGKNRVSWDGYDSSGVTDLRQDPRTTALVVAYTLPENSIITHGNNEQSYKAWFEKLDLTPKDVSVDDQVLARGSVRIAREYYRSRYLDNEAKITLDLLAAGESLSKPYILNTNATLRVNADEASQWLLDESLYEVGFFVDGLFVSEEEQGYLPMSWRLNASEYGEGDHVLTVNISGFDGRVGVASTGFTVKK